MAEDGAEAAVELEAQAASQVPEPAAAAVAMTLGTGGKLAPESAAYLEAQTQLARLQMEHLHEQRSLQIDHLKQQEKHLRLRFFGDRLRIGLQILGIVAGMAVVGFLAAMAWNAHEDHGVAIEAFSVPPDLAQRGLTGQVVASQLLDRLADLQARTVTTRPASTYANDWGGDIKVEIPETGVSIGELNRYLREWLGSATRISGEVVRTSTGLAVTARAGAGAGRTFEGPETDLNRLVQQAAEAIYAQTQPYRHAVYLQSSGRTAEAEAAYAGLAQSGPAKDRPWALAGWASVLLGKGDLRGAAEKGNEAIHIAPEIGAGYPFAYTAESLLSHHDAAMAIARQAQRSLHGRGILGGFSGVVAVAEGLGDVRGAARAFSPGNMSAEGRSTFLDGGGLLAMALASDHEVTRAREVMSRIDPAVARRSVLQPWGIEVFCRFTLDDWAGVMASMKGLAFAPGMSPQIGRALTSLGRVREAQAMVEDLPLDCDDCVLARGVVAAGAGDWPAADRWFAQAARQDSTGPGAPTEWGRALLAKGDVDGAIAKLKEAHRRGPHYADPLELWGEALMKKGDFPGAIRKFAEADPNAPRWGRNHLRWGEALLRSGRYREARAQFEAANGMDLSRPDHAALDVFLARTAKGPLHG
jgi:tetratricopeptide (TPR) repeat protein